MTRAADIVIPPAGGPYDKPRFAPNDLIEAQRPFVDEFWSEVLGTSYATSFVSNDGQLSAWEHYVGGREALIVRVRDVYGVDITDVYERPQHEVLTFVRAHANYPDSSPSEAEMVELVGFEDDGGLRSLLSELSVYDDYKVILPRNLTDIFRKQFPETVLSATELIGEPDCEVHGVVGDDGSLTLVQEVTATMPLRVTLHVGASGYLLDIRLGMRIEGIDEDRRTIFDLDIDSQVALT